MKCSNFVCLNELTDFELKRIKSKRSVYRFCSCCRSLSRNLREVVLICPICENVFTTTELISLRCKNCKGKDFRENHKKKDGMLINAVKIIWVVNQKEKSAIVDISKASKFMQKLQNKGFKSKFVFC